jgi:hypothetical protein
MFMTISTSSTYRIQLSIQCGGMRRSSSSSRRDPHRHPPSIPLSILSSSSCSSPFLILLTLFSSSTSSPSNRSLSHPLLIILNLLNTCPTSGSLTRQPRTAYQCITDCPQQAEKRTRGGGGTAPLSLYGMVVIYPALHCTGLHSPLPQYTVLYFLFCSFTDLYASIL